MTSSVKLILRSQQTKNNKYHINPDVSVIPGDDVCVLYIGGNGTQTDKDSTGEQKANGLAKTIEQQVIDVFPNDIPIYAVKYEFDEHDSTAQNDRTRFLTNGTNTRFEHVKHITINDKNMDYKIKNEVLSLFIKDKKLISPNQVKTFLLRTYLTGNNPDNTKKLFLEKLSNQLIQLGYDFQDVKKICKDMSVQIDKDNTYSTEYIYDLFNKTLLPRISENSKRLPLTTALQRIRKINIVAHCHGAYVAQMMEDIAVKTMRDLGYSGDEINQILSQLLIVAHAPSQKPRKSKTHFLGFISGYDDTVDTTSNYVSEYIKRNAQRDQSYMLIHNIPEMEHKWLPHPVFLGGNNGNMFIIARGFKIGNQSDGGWGTNSNEHKNTQYAAMADQNKDGFILNLMARNVLRNGIKNSLSNTFVPLPDNSDLIKWNDSESENIPTFQDMVQNGKQFITNVLISAREYIRQTPKKTKKTIIPPGMNYDK